MSSLVNSDGGFTNSVGKVVGIELFRIEDFKPVHLQASQLGKFHVGDSYIILATLEDKNRKITWNIHFWLGNESSQDEKGAAAYKAVELDNALGGAAVQYRELQGSESNEFLSLFKTTGIEYLPGGVQSGFNTVVKDVYPTRLLLCKGRRTVRVSEVPLSSSSLNRSDVFLLDKGLTIYIFNGPEANKYEKLKGIETANRINADSRSGRAFVAIVEDASDSTSKEFWEELGGYVSPTSLPSSEDDDEPLIKASPKLFHICNASGSVEFNSIPLPDNKLKKDLLKGEDCYMVVSNDKVYIWVGKGSTLEEKRESTVLAEKYCTENGINTKNISRVVEGCETSSFKSEFALWNAPFNIKQTSSGVAGKINDAQIDIQELLANKAAEETPVDDGSGNITIWRIENFQKVAVAKEQYGQFYSGDAYIILYEYKDKRNTDRSIIYFWLGNNSSTDEKGSAALLTKELDDEMGGRPLQVRVVQGKEPLHFSGLFKGNMVVHQGGKASGFKNMNAADSYDTDGTSLFHVKGTNALNTYAIQVDEKASSLNSLDEFVLVVPDKVFVWNGSGANEIERNVALQIANKLSNGTRAVESIDEGSEPSDFWEYLGGQGEYANVSSDALPREARLFHASTASGGFKVEEIHRFSQEDLIDDDVMLLDTFTQIFVWIGSRSTDEEKQKSFDFAVRFSNEARDGRDVNIPIIKINAGEEPIFFTCHFHAWDSEFAAKNTFNDPYEQKMKELRAQKAKKEQEIPNANPAPKVISVAKESSVPPIPVPTPLPHAPAAMSVITPSRDPPPVKNFAAPVTISESGPLAPIPVSAFLSYEQLRDAFPEGIDKTRKEEYLSDDEFVKIIGCDKASFRALPAWKRNDKKKSLGLF